METAGFISKPCKLQWLAAQFLSGSKILASINFDILKQLNKLQFKKL
jgi:hypothetical protein